MKTHVMAALALAAATLLGAENVKELKVLTIGNSFSASLGGIFPSVVQSDPSCKLKLQGANIGGCPLERHWKLHEKSLKDPSAKPYNKKFTLLELLRKEKWDIVTIQQASPSSWKAETYQPYADQIIALIRKEAPQATIMIQQTWSYNAGSPYFEKNNLTQTEMYEKLAANYKTLSEKYGYQQIPSGYAVQLYRKALGDKLVKVDIKTFKNMKKPELPANNDVVGGFSWRKDKKTGKESIGADWIHLNNDGRYLQSLVWYGILYGKDPKQVKFVPKGMSKEQETLLKKCAAEAVTEYTKKK